MHAAFTASKPNLKWRQGMGANLVFTSNRVRPGISRDSHTQHLISRLLPLTRRLLNDQASEFFSSCAASLIAISSTASGSRGRRQLIAAAVRSKSSAESRPGARECTR